MSFLHCQVTAIVNKLVDALKVPSESVQKFAAERLVPLIAGNKEAGASVLDVLLSVRVLVLKWLPTCASFTRMLHLIQCNCARASYMV